MAAITYSDILTKKAALMSGGLRLAVIVAIPTATSDATAGVFLVKDPDVGDAVAAADAAGTAKNAWKSYSYADVATAYGV